MCGILGGISVEPIELLNQPQRLRAAIDLLKHRGPDDHGQLILRDRKAFLGHRRLSIVDVGGGHQPIDNEDRQIHFCYNGEIYNSPALRTDLSMRGHTFRTRSDGECALHLYEDEPAEFVRRLSGMYAIAILDEREKALTLARDRNGIKPLYYFFNGRTLLFASELKAILAMQTDRPRVSPRAVREYLRWKYVPSPLTIYEGINKLPPGHILTARPTADGRRLEVQSSRYWQLDYSGGKTRNEVEAIEELDVRLREVVKSHLLSDVEVGALLSGGVDSSLVVAMACEVSGKPIRTFSVGFEEEGFDQLPFARVLAKRYKTRHHEEHVHWGPIAASAALARQFDEPFADSSALASYRVCQVASRHVKVVLTVDGGDETFAGYNRYQEVIDFDGSQSLSRSALNRFVMATSGALFSPEAKFLKKFRDTFKTALELHEAHQVMCSRYLCDRILADPYHEAVDDESMFETHRRRAVNLGWQPMDIAQYIDLRMYLPDDILTKVDRTSMACSLECRVPILDHTITEFSATLAPELKIRGDVRKYLLKKVAERYVPRELIYRPKMGFRVPIRRWFKRELLDETAILLQDGALVARGILDPHGIRWMLRQQRKPWIDFASQLWALLMMEQWARAYPS